MLYLVAILVPSIGMLLAGRVVQALLCVLLQITLIGWPIAAIWACLVVAESKANKRNDKLIRAMQGA